MAQTATNPEKRAGAFEDPKKYAGYEVRDPLGRKIGRATELFVNGSDEPEYVVVRMGLLGLKTALIPVLTVAVDEERRLSCCNRANGAGEDALTRP